MDERPKSIYHTGAADGLTMGLYLGATFICQVLSLKILTLGLFAELMVLGVPFMAYFLMRRSYKSNAREKPFSTIWMHGITIFICGSLILGLVQYVYTRFINPDFIPMMAQTAVDAYMSLPSDDGRQFGVALQQIIDKHLLPTPIGFTITAIWLISFIGCLLSLAITVILKLVYKNRK